LWHGVVRGENLTKWLRVSDEIYSFLLNEGKKKETFDGVLRRLLKIGEGAGA